MKPLEFRRSAEFARVEDSQAIDGSPVVLMLIRRSDNTYVPASLNVTDVRLLAKWLDSWLAEAPSDD